MKKHRTKSILLSMAAGAIVLSSTFISSPARAENSNRSPGDTISAPAPLSPELKAARRDHGLTKEKLDQNGGDPILAKYWTPERMAKAIPVDVPSGSIGRPNKAEIETKGSRPQERDKSVMKPTAPKNRREARKTEKSAVTNFSETNGKIFFRDAKDGVDYVCSGSAISSESRRLVSTAGHCVHGGPGGTWHQNWVFIPGYHNGAKPYGMFSARTFRTFNEWIQNGQSFRGFNSDVAFVTTYANSYGRVVDAVGGHGLWIGGSLDFDVSLFGYPMNLNNGEIMWACWGRSGVMAEKGYWFPAISGCNFGGGASGGPWLYQYNNTTGLGYLRTLSSFGPRESPDFIAGPYFDSRVETLYWESNGDWF